MPLPDDELQEILTIFKAESEEHLQKLSEGIILLEKEPGRREVIEEIFREAHSLKGAARMIGFEDVEKVAHSLEDIFNEVRKGKLVMAEAVSDYVLEGLDLVNRIVQQKLQGRGKGGGDISGFVDRLAGILASASPPAEEQPDRDAQRDRRGGTKETPEPEEPEQAEEAEEDLRPEKIDLSTPEPPESHGVSPEEVPESPPDSTPPSPAEGQAVNIGVREELRRGIKDAEAKVRIRKRQSESAEVTPRIEETIRVSIEKLDELMAQVGEILVTKIKADQRLQEYKSFLQRLGEFQKVIHRHNLAFISRRGGRDEALHSAVRVIQETARRVDELVESAVRIGDGLGDENLRLELISGSIQESVNRIRMLPLSAIFNYFPRLVRDMSREQKKEVELVIRGAETRLDKRILEELKSPLTHLLRNSMDHGIEEPAEREEMGKPRQGKLLLTAYQKGNNVLVDLEDDGRGIDAEKIKQVALKRGFISREALAELSPAQIIQIIFQPGFSTKSIITDVSGRGVGLDVVLTNIERLKGKISTASIPGRGTKFSIKMPLTLATTQALLIKVGAQRFAIPLTAVEYTGEVDIEEISTVEGRETVLVAGQPTGLIRMAEVLGIPERAGNEEVGRIPLVVLSSTDDRVAFVVDEFIGEGEVVVKNLGSHLARVPNVAGATLLADGTPVMILNVFDLIKSARKAGGYWVIEKIKAREKRAARHTVMVVDDSITTRTLEKNILESSGYSVVTAVDGVEAVERLRSKKVDLVVSDIQMPRMDGFALTVAIKRDRNWNHLPVILVTSLESEEDRKRGIDAGADAYITKGAFDQGNLLNTIKQLL